MSNSVSGWRTALVVQGRTLTDVLVPVAVGIVGTSGGEHLGMRLAGDTVLFTDVAGGQLVTVIQAALEEKAKRAEAQS